MFEPNEQLISLKTKVRLKMATKTRSCVRNGPNERKEQRERRVEYVEFMIIRWSWSLDVDRTW